MLHPSTEKETNVFVPFLIEILPGKLNKFSHVEDVFQCNNCQKNGAKINKSRRCHIEILTFKHKKEMILFSFLLCDYCHKKCKAELREGHN